ncbi:MAG: hypothetical protein AAF430_08560 [Myxococcota bacterium]
MRGRSDSRSRRGLAGLAGGCALWVAIAATAEDAVYRAADPDHPEITAASLAEAERFWPHEVRTLEPWTPTGAGDALAPGPARLVRVEGDHARLDLGEAGVHDVPIAVTDVVARANLVRVGALEKVAPNAFVVLGSHLLDATGKDAGAHALDPGEYDTFLCLFAEVVSPEFRAVAESLSDLTEREDLQIVLVPQDDRRDARVWRRLREVGLAVPFVLRTEAAARTRTLLDPGTPMPQVLLLSAEGRVLYQSVWRPEPPPAPAEADGAQDALR